MGRMGRLAIAAVLATLLSASAAGAQFLDGPPANSWRPGEIEPAG